MSQTGSAVFPNRSTNILIVDDQPNNLRILSEMLVQEGFKVRQAINCQVAFTIQASVPDLSLLDVMMPGIDGYEVCPFPPPPHANSPFQPL